MKKWFSLSALAIAMIFAACSPGDTLPVPDPDPTDTTQNPSTPCNIVMVTGNITTPTTWKAGNVYVVDISLKIESTLTIEPGTVIKIKGKRIDVQNDGRIIAAGTEGGRIVFTSYNDDSYCGDTNGDGAATAPGKGDWVALYLNGTHPNIFKYCDFLYAGANDGGYYTAVVISVIGFKFEFDHCTFAHTLSNSSASPAFAFHGGSYMTDPDVSRFTNNAFYDNDRPLYCSFDYTVNPNNVFHNPAKPTEKNKRNGIFMWGGIGSDVAFKVTEVPYVFMENFSGGGSAAVRNITVGPNAVLKFMRSDWGIARGDDNHVNIGAGAVLTSYKDDGHGGDTNGDGTATTPATGDWEGFWDYSANDWVSGSYIKYAAN